MQGLARRFESRYADAHGRAAVLRFPILNGAAEAVRNNSRAGCVRTRKQHDELLAAITRHAIGRPRRLDQNARHIAQNAIAHRVAVRIVELLEVVDVENGERERLLVPHRQPVVGVEAFAKRAAISHLRQIVGDRKILQRGISRFELVLVVRDLFFLLVQVVDHRFEFARIETRLEISDHLLGQNFERGTLLGAQLARLAVDHTERPDVEPRAGLQRHAGVKTDVRLAHHERIIREALIFRSIGHDHGRALQNRIAAEGHFPRRLRHVKAHARLEPLALGVDEADRRNGRVADGRSQPRQLVEGVFRLAVENVEVVERQQARRLVRRKGWRYHLICRSSRAAA